MRHLLGFLTASLLVGCATTSSGDYAKVYDRKYNEVHVVKADSPGTFVGTGSTKQSVRSPAQHP